MKQIIGLDIGSYSIKIVELEHRKGQFCVSRCLSSNIKSGDVKSSLRDLINSGILPSKKVNVALQGPSVIVRYIEMPPMKKEELKSAIRYEAEKYIPFDIKQSVIDFAILEGTSSGAFRVLLVAAKREVVDRLMQMLNDVGLQINLIDVDSFALLNAFQRSEISKDAKKTHALIDIGATFANMDIVSDNKVYFTRDILWGGMDVTKRIKDALGISFDEAEALKISPGERRQEVTNIIEPILERFSSQVRMSFDYFESQFAKNVEYVYISGGSSYLFNIIDFLKENLGVEVAIWNPFEKITVSDSVEFEGIKTTPAIFTVGVGLALRQ